MRVCIALANDQPVAIKDVLTVIRIVLIHNLCDLSEVFLFWCHRCAFEDAVVSAADLIFLVIGKMHILWNDLIIHTYITRDSLCDFYSFIKCDIYT